MDDQEDIIGPSEQTHDPSRAALRSQLQGTREPSSPARSSAASASRYPLSRLPPSSPLPSSFSAGPPSTPQWSRSSQMQPTQNFSQFDVSATPLVMGTPRSPTRGYVSQLASPAVSASGFQVPRSDMGRSNIRIVYGQRQENNAGQIPPTPSTMSTALDPWDNRSEAGNESVFGDQAFARREEFHSALPADLNNAYIWGTTVNVQNCINEFKFFFDEFVEGASATGLSYYHQQLHIMHSTGSSVLNLNCRHLNQFPAARNLFKQLERYPQEIIPLMDQVVNEEYMLAFSGQDIGNRRIQVRTFGLQTQRRMRALDPIHIDTLVSIKGMVTRCSAVIPDLKQAFFRCFTCAHTVDVPMTEKGHIDEPHSCPSCQSVASMEMIHNRSLFSDKQCIRIQETPDEIPEGETPYTLTAFAYDDLVDTVRPGDRVELTGIFRAVAKRINPRIRTLNSIFKTFVDCIHFRRVNSTEGSAQSDAADPLAASNGPPMFPADRVQQFHEFVRAGDVYNRLVRSFAPSIWELTDVKRGALCMLFGGNLAEAKQRKLAQRLGESPQAGPVKVHQRSEINILLCGDPGTSKSQILGYVHKLSPRGIYTSGKGSSAVGLTASVVKDPDSGDMVLESGALVLSDSGICCIDEFDKMSDMTRAILHEAMEQQTVSITKAGIVATLNARTAILASANPVESRYNPRLSVVENIKLPPTLLSRFDLIYLILDRPSADDDRQLARHIVSLYYDDDTLASIKEAAANSNLGTVDQTFMRDFIAYARATCAPEICSEAEEILVRGYLAMRALGSGGRGGASKTITSTTRQLESLIRLSQALAKMRLADIVEAADMEEAIRLMRVATQAAATDPRTGTIDMDMLTTGKTSLNRDLILKLAEQLRVLLTSSSYRGQKLTFAALRQLLVNQSGRQGEHAGLSVTITEVEEAARELDSEGIVQISDSSMSVLVR